MHENNRKAAQDLLQKIPLLPGHSKSHAFDFCNRVSVFNGEKPGIGGKDLFGQKEAKIATSVEIYPHTNASGECVPAWLAFDRKVLRFYAYFQEAVHEKREEQYRIRRVNIYFYLEDDTIHVSEPKYANSGIPQGTLIRRHRIPKGSSSNGQHFIISDLNVADEVTFYSRTFKIVGCDQFTREFLSTLSIAVPKSTDFPPDPYQIQRQELLSRLKPTRPCVPNTSLKKFLENDRHVLRFYCVWDDTNTVFGDMRHMVVHYYLSDDTIDIHESIPNNSGRQPNSMFLRRCKLPKHTTAGASALSGKMPDAYFTERDFTLGAVLHLNGRPFVVCDCDEFTKEFYREKYGLETFDPVRVEDYDEEPVPEDAAQKLEDEKRVWSMVPDSAHHPINEPGVSGGNKGFRKRYDGLFLRFLAVLKTTKQVDTERKFVISLYLADDSVSVFEPHQRNSGIVGGKYLEKGKIRKPNGVDLYGLADFFIGEGYSLMEFQRLTAYRTGAELTLHSHTFIIKSADEYALQFMSQHPAEFPNFKK
ncbi:EF-hand domain-containing member C2 [Podochytrium sp. JEL0797]|nr:EF-hand domain-containing member C2 [Podochytrium sp. JEL0797]